MLLLCCPQRGELFNSCVGSLFWGFAGGITRRMVRAAAGSSTCVEFVGSERAYDDNQFIPLPVSKGKNHPKRVSFTMQKRESAEIVF